MCREALEDKKLENEKKLPTIADVIEIVNAILNSAKKVVSLMN